MQDIANPPRVGGDQLLHTEEGSLAEMERESNTHAKVRAKILGLRLCEECSVSPQQQGVGEG